MGEDPYGQEDEEEEGQENDQSREERLRHEKELFKQQMGLVSDKKKQQAAKVAPEVPQ